VAPSSKSRTSHLNPIPADGTLINDNATGMVYEIAGGAPLYVSDWNAIGGLRAWVGVDHWDLANLTNPAAHLNPVPADGTTLTTLAGQYYEVINGFPLPSSTPLGNAVLIDAQDIAHAGQAAPWNCLL
jgi:hypothetical protein